MKLFGRRQQALSQVSPDWLPAPGRNVDPPAKGFQLGFAFSAPLDLVEAVRGLGGGPVSRRDALSVPAVLSARRLIAGTLSTLPISVYDGSLAEDGRNTVVRNMQPGVPDCYVYSQTFEDLMFFGVSYWRVTRFSAEGFPVEAIHLDYRAVANHTVFGLPSQVLSEDLQFVPSDPVFVDGFPVPPNEIIRFVSPNPPLLIHAARAIRSALLLDQVAALYAQDPMPLGYFTDQDSTTSVLDDAEVQDVLDRWAQARRQRAYGYVPGGLKLELPQWDADQIQLADARQHAVLEIARATGLDPEDLGVSTTSRTYQNAEQRRQDRIAFTLAPYMTAVEQRLSQDDVLPRGLHARFETDGFLRADTKTRMEANAIAAGIGALTVDEIRRAEHMPPLTAAQRNELRPATPSPQMSDEGNANGRLRIAN